LRRLWARIKAAIAWVFFPLVVTWRLVRRIVGAVWRAVSFVWGAIWRRPSRVFAVLWLAGMATFVAMTGVRAHEVWLADARRGEAPAEEVDAGGQDAGIEDAAPEGGRRRRHRKDGGVARRRDGGIPKGLKKKIMAAYDAGGYRRLGDGGIEDQIVDDYYATAQWDGGDDEGDEYEDDEELDASVDGGDGGEDGGGAVARQGDGGAHGAAGVLVADEGFVEGESRSVVSAAAGASSFGDARLLGMGALRALGEAWPARPPGGARAASGARASGVAAMAALEDAWPSDGSTPAAHRAAATLRAGLVSLRPSVPFEVTTRGRRVVVAFGDGAPFVSPTSAKLTVDADVVLGRVAPLLSAVPGARFAAWARSPDRVRRVSRALAAHGVPAPRIAASVGAGVLAAEEEGRFSFAFVVLPSSTGAAGP
jgi:hypothetical protein